jgi:ABC-2 type transport system permease protein
VRNILLIIQKEFRQIFRNKQIVAAMIFMPILQLLILANAATFEMKNLRIFIVDKDFSSLSRNISSKFSASNYFIVSAIASSSKEAEDFLHKRQVDLYLEIPQNFENNLFRENTSTLQLTINAIDGVKAAIGMQYASNIIADANLELIQKNAASQRLSLNSNIIKSIKTSNLNWFNEEMDYKTFMVPGILVILISIVGLFLASMNIVREKEIGTIEQLNVTPIKKYQLILGKLIPFWVLGLFLFGFGLFLSKLLYNIPFLGNPILLFSIAAIYLTLVLGIGLLISTFTETQQQAMFLTWFFTMIFVLMSGLFTAIENMPNWAQNITLFNPLRYMIESVRMVMLKGSGFSDVKLHITILLSFSILMNGLAVLNYQKRA